MSFQNSCSLPYTIPIPCSKNLQWFQKFFAFLCKVSQSLWIYLLGQQHWGVVPGLVRPSTCWESERPCLPDTSSSLGGCDSSTLCPQDQVEGLWAIVDFPAIGTVTPQRMSEHLSFLAYFMEIGTWEVGLSHLVCRVLNI